jgi:hypothetical protein
MIAPPYAISGCGILKIVPERCEIRVSIPIIKEVDNLFALKCYCVKGFLGMFSWVFGMFLV